MKKEATIRVSAMLSGMRIKEDVFIFESTGRSFTANKNIIGINDNLEIYEGYDSSIDVTNKDGKYYYEVDEEIEELTAEEKKELALHMIELWKSFGGIE